MRGTVLVLGASGRFGRHAVSAFSYAGWTVRRFQRGADNLWDAAWGADVIVNGWNPASADWARDLPVQTAQILEVARASGATVILPGNVAVYDPSAAVPWGPDTARGAPTALGQLRVEMEAAYRASGVQTCVVRGGDFLDTAASGTWFDKVLAAQLAQGRMTYPGPLGCAHAWSWLPDLAEVAQQLAARRDTLRPFEEVTVPGFTLTAEALAAALARVTRRDVQLREMSWWPLRAAAPVWPRARALLEMRYLWDRPHALDGARLADLLPDFEPTPLDEALAAAIASQVDPDQPARACRCHGLRVWRPFCRPQNA